MPVIIPSEATMDWLNVKYAAGDVLKAAWLDVQFQPEKGQQISIVFTCIKQNCEN